MRALLACALVSISSVAAAQQQPENRGGVTVTYDKSRSAAANAGRAKALAGDCKGALDFFDEALRHSIDPTLYRDRGTCHEKLGHVYPAIYDYRAYVSQAPEAADVDKYRKRVDDLISTSSQDMAPGMGFGGSYESEMGGVNYSCVGVACAFYSNDGTKKKVETDTKPKDDQSKPTVAIVEYEEERDHETAKASMRSGTGFAVGAFYTPRYTANPWGFGAGQGVGAKLAWVFSSASALFVELGFLGHQSTSGLMSLLGYEARISLDRWATNQIVLAAGGGYEHQTDDLLGQVYANIVGRGRAGYRHVFGASLGLEFYIDGGVIGTFLLQPPAGAKSAGIGGFIGGLVALNVGF
jgi:hypothetical protein